MGYKARQRPKRATQMKLYLQNTEKETKILYGVRNIHPTLFLVNLYTKILTWIYNPTLCTKWWARGLDIGVCLFKKRKKNK